MSNNKNWVDMKAWIKRIKDNKLYLIISLIGIVMLTIGGIIWDCCFGKILLCVGIIAFLISTIIGLRNKDLEWKEFE